MCVYKASARGRFSVFWEVKKSRELYRCSLGGKGTDMQIHKAGAERRAGSRAGLAPGTRAGGATKALAVLMSFLLVLPLTLGIAPSVSNAEEADLVAVESGLPSGDPGDPAPDAIITFTITGESEYTDALYLPQGVAVTDGALLQGVVATDENGVPVAVAIRDADGLDRANPQPRGSFPPDPYLITYEALHPVTGEPFTQTREAYVTVGIMPLASDSFLVNGSATHGYSNIQDALSMEGFLFPSATCTITLTADITYSSSLGNLPGQDVILETSGYTLTVSSTIGAGLFLAPGTNWTITGSGEFNVTGTSEGVVATGGSKVTVTNAIATASNGTGVYANGAGTRVTVLGNASGGQHGVSASADSEVSVGGNARGAQMGVIADMGGRVVVAGYALATDTGPTAYGAWANGVGAPSGTASSITVGGYAQGGGGGASAGNGGKVEVAGDALATGTGTSVSGAKADGAGSSVTVGGKAEGGNYGAWASNGGKVEVAGDSKATDSGINSCGALASGDGSLVVVGGNAQGAQTGVSAEMGGRVEVAGYALATGTGITVYGAWAIGVGAPSGTASFITVGGYAQGGGVGASAGNGGKVEVAGDSKATGTGAGTSGAKADDAGSSVTVGGKAEGGNFGAWASNGGKVEVADDSKATGSGINSYGASASGESAGVASYISVGGSAQGEKGGVRADGGAKVEVGGNAIATGTDSSGAEVNGFGVSSGTSSTITVGGNAQGSTAGVWASMGGRVEVAGNAIATGSGTGISGVRAEGDSPGGTGSYVAVGGDASGSEYGVFAFMGGKVEITGNVTGASTGVSAAGPDTSVTVGGNVRATDAGGTGVYALLFGSITIEGKIFATVYIDLGGPPLTINDGIKSITYPGYFIYSDGMSMVLVKEAYACEIIGTDGTTVLAKYLLLADALAVVTTGQIIRLLDNIEHSSNIAVDAKTLTLETNGFNLNVVTADMYGLSVTGGNGKFFLDDSLGGQFNVTTSNASSDSAGVFATAGCEATVSNATATGGGSGARAVSGRIDVLGDATGVIYGAQVNNSDGRVTVGGNARATGTSPGATTCTGAYAVSGGRISVAGNAEGSAYGAYAAGGGGISIGGNATATGTAAGIGVYVSGAGAGTNTVHVGGNATGFDNGVYAQGGYTVTVGGNTVATGGTATGTTGGIGAYAQASSTVTVDGHATGVAFGVSANSGSNVTIKGNATATGTTAGTGAFAHASILIVEGNASGFDFGVSANGGSNVTIKGDATATGTTAGTGAFAHASILIVEGNASGFDFGANAASSSTVTVEGNATGNKVGAQTTSSSTLTVLGSALATGATAGKGVNVESGGSATIRGDARGLAYGVYAAPGGSATVLGDAVATGTASGTGVYKTGSDTVSVEGSVSGFDLGVYAASGGIVNVGENVTSNTKGVQADNGGIVTVGGNVTVTGLTTGIGVSAGYGAAIEVGGDVSVTATSGIGAQAGTGCEVTIDGAITAATYIQVGNLTFVDKTAADFANPPAPAKVGYRTYTDTGATVWVKGALPTIDGGAAPGTDVIELTAGYTTGNTRAYAIGNDLAVTGIATQLSVTGIAGATIDSTGLLTIPTGLAAGSYTLTITADNGVALDSASPGNTMTITVNILKDSNIAPRTGDSSLAAWAFLLLAAVLGSASLLLWRRQQALDRRRGQHAA